MRCLAHIINLAVQSALKSLKADLDADFNSYRVEEHEARIPRSVETAAVRRVIDCLAKLRRHVFVFNNRRGWRAALEKQTEAQCLTKPTLLEGYAGSLELHAHIAISVPSPTPTYHCCMCIAINGY